MILLNKDIELAYGPGSLVHPSRFRFVIGFADAWRSKPHSCALVEAQLPKIPI